MAHRYTPLKRKSKSSTATIIAIVATTTIVFAAFKSFTTTSQNVAPVTKEIVVSNFESVKIYVPTKIVPKGTQLKDVSFKKISYPLSDKPLGIIEEIEPFLNYHTLVDLPAGMPIQEQNLSVEKIGSNPVAERIPDGMRAMTVKVDPTSLVNGWAGPGSLVDVVLLTNKKSIVLAEGIKILSTEKFVSNVDGAPAEGLPTTATILVTQEDALSISTGMPHGKIIFMLRNVNDQGEWNSKELGINNLSKQNSKSKKFNGYIKVKDGRSFSLSDKNSWIEVTKPPQGSILK